MKEIFFYDFLLLIRSDGMPGKIQKVKTRHIKIQALRKYLFGNR